MGREYEAMERWKEWAIGQIWRLAGQPVGF